MAWGRRQERKVRSAAAEWPITISYLLCLRSIFPPRHPISDPTINFQDTLARDVHAELDDVFCLQRCSVCHSRAALAAYTRRCRPTLELSWDPILVGLSTARLS